MKKSKMKWMSMWVLAFGIGSVLSTVSANADSIRSFRAITCAGSSGYVYRITLKGNDGELTSRKIKAYDFKKGTSLSGDLVITAEQPNEDEVNLSADVSSGMEGLFNFSGQSGNLLTFRLPKWILDPSISSSDRGRFGMVMDHVTDESRAILHTIDDLSCVIQVSN